MQPKLPYAEQMIQRSSTIAFFAATAFSVSLTHAASIFYSTSNIGGSSANEDLTLNLNNGDSAKVYIYLDFFSSEPTPNDLSGFELSYSTSTTGVAHFNAAEVLDFSVASGGFRWNINAGLPIGALAVTNNTITNLATTTSMGAGLENFGSTSLPNLDSGWDSTSGSSPVGAFLIGSIDLTAVGSGSTNINLTSGSFTPISGASAPAPVSRTITVNVAPVPEPSSTLLIAIGSVSLILRRNKK